METVILKFGGSSVATNEKLKKVATTIIEYYNKKNNIIVVVSAQGKTTDKLVNEAYQLSNKPIDRELDVLVSSGEQISIAKLSILLNEMGYKAISLTGWQAGIYTNNQNINAIIENIDTARINMELKQNKIVIVAGFQGYNQNLDISTLGRGGSDTSAVALAIALNAKKCFIYSDVNGVYSIDPNKYKDAKKYDSLSYNEMLEMSSEGAEVLNNRAINIAKKNNIPLIIKSTFNNSLGTTISKKIENDNIKSVIKKDISRLTFVGNRLFNHINTIVEILEIINNNNLEILELNMTESKISIDFKDMIADEVVNEIHKIIIS